MMISLINVVIYILKYMAIRYIKYISYMCSDIALAGHILFILTIEKKNSLRCIYLQYQYVF